MRLIWMAIVALWAMPSWAEPRLVSDFVWNRDNPLFGGVSGIALDPSGTTFIAITDKGLITSGRFTRENGRITGIENGPMIPLQNRWGERLRDGNNDSEGLAVAPDGRIYVSFEGRANIRFYKDMHSKAAIPAPHPDFATFQPNSSLEALALDTDGWAYSLPERSGRATRPFQVYRTKGISWERSFTISREGPFLPVGADFGPDGKFYLLERDFTGIGFRSRVRRFDRDGTNEETILQTSNATHDNLEGISVWRDVTGALMLTMVADDNFQFLQQTEIVEYRLTD